MNVYVEGNVVPAVVEEEGATLHHHRAYSSLSFIDWLRSTVLEHWSLTGELACLGGAVGSVAECAACYGDRRVWVRGPGWPDHCVRLYRRML